MRCTRASVHISATGYSRHVAVAAEELQAFVEHVALHVGEPELVHRRHLGGQLALQVRGDAGVVEGAGGGGVGGALGELEAGVLELQDRAAEGLALLGVGDGALDRALHRADGAAADDQPLLRELLHHLVEALALGAAEQVLRRTGTSSKKSSEVSAAFSSRSCRGCGRG